MAKPTLWLPSMMAVLTPTTWPSAFRRGPPELPGLIAASVWIRFVRLDARRLDRCGPWPTRSRASRWVAHRVRAHCRWPPPRRPPGATRWSPSSAGVHPEVFWACTRAMSSLGSEPTSVASTCWPSKNRMLMSSARATTCALVRTRPSSEMTHTRAGAAVDAPGRSGLDRHDRRLGLGQERLDVEAVALDPQVGAGLGCRRRDRRRRLTRWGRRRRSPGRDRRADRNSPAGHHRGDDRGEGAGQQCRAPPRRGRRRTLPAPWSTRSASTDARRSCSGSNSGGRIGSGDSATGVWAPAVGAGRWEATAAGSSDRRVGSGQVRGADRRRAGARASGGPVTVPVRPAAVADEASEPNGASTENRSSASGRAVGMYGWIGHAGLRGEGRCTVPNRRTDLRRGARLRRALERLPLAMLVALIRADRPAHGEDGPLYGNFRANSVVYHL